MASCKDLKQNQKIGCEKCGLQLMVVKECQSKEKCSQENGQQKHFICCGKQMSAS